MSSMEKLPVGVRFHPTDNELVDHHLRMKLNGKSQKTLLIPELNIYQCEPLDLFSKYDELSDIQSDGQECFFFCPQRNKNMNSHRFTSNRKTELGYWKDTCNKRTIRARDGKEIGTKRIFVYHQGRQRKGYRHKTDIVMHEYHLNSSVRPHTISGLMAFVLCRIINRQRNKTLSPNKLAHEASVEATSEAVVESENRNKSSNFEAPESSKSPLQQTQLREGTFWCGEDLEHPGHCPQASPAAVVESENLNKSSNFDAPGSSKSSPQQTQIQESTFLCDEESAINDLINELYSPSNDGISFKGLEDFE